ncbi:LLM class flavin-dependent oxidoreductase [Myxococcota bacterium]|nr:LLM class flavin-dependent oxidoreductase [Myxococcota bacterium]
MRAKGRNPLDIIAFADGLPSAELLRFVQRLEALGYDTVWIPEFFGREPYSTVAYLLGRTHRIKIATGIANVYARDAIVTAQHRHGLAELSEGRFVLGLGVSHPPMAEAHGMAWQAPLKKMREYLDVLESFNVQAPKPENPAPLWISAHGPKLLDLAAHRADGANTYLAPPAHTEKARQILGPHKRLNVVLHCCLCEDPVRARPAARRALSIYMALPAYHRLWQAWGFESSDYENGPSDRLIDTLVAWGNQEAIEEQMDAHREAGATQIVMSPLQAEGPETPWALIETMAPQPASI